MILSCNMDVMWQRNIKQKDQFFPLHIIFAVQYQTKSWAFLSLSNAHNKRLLLVRFNFYKCHVPMAPIFQVPKKLNKKASASKQYSV